MPTNRQKCITLIERLPKRNKTWAYGYQTGLDRRRPKPEIGVDSPLRTRQTIAHHPVLAETIAGESRALTLGGHTPWKPHLIQLLGNVAIFLIHEGEGVPDVTHATSSPDAVYIVIDIGG